MLFNTDLSTVVWVDKMFMHGKLEERGEETAVA
jgi:hypothetical protein